jgi:glycosyltransferase involved in cell wall biosynthesis
MCVSVVVLTLNEEASLPDCLASAAGLGDLHVLDCGSTDATAAVARAHHAAVHVHPFEGFGRQRNWAIDHIPTRHDWHLHLDADERLTPELVEEITRTLAADPPAGGFLVPSKLMFAGRWLRHAGQYPAYQVRLFHRRRLRFHDHGHGQREQTDYPLGRLQHPLLHHAFSKGLDHWFAKHAVYARLEAAQAFAPAQPDGAPSSLFSRDPLLRRRALKRLAARLPGRYFLRLAYMMLIKRAFLDGAPGITYAHMLATYEAMIDVHLRMLRHGMTP